MYPIGLSRSGCTEKRYISQAAHLVALVVTCIAKDLLRQRDVLRWIDNTAALTALIKVGSPVEDNSHMALIFSLNTQALEARVWAEHIGSNQNPSDGLSRDGYQDREVKKFLTNGEWEKLEAEVDRQMLLQPTLKEVWSYSTALGDS